MNSTNDLKEHECGLRDALCVLLKDAAKNVEIVAEHMRQNEGAHNEDLFTELGHISTKLYQAAHAVLEGREHEACP